MTTYFKDPLAPDALAEPLPPHGLLCVFKALTTHKHLHIYTHNNAMQIYKSHNVSNDTPDTYFIVWTK